MNHKFHLHIMTVCMFLGMVFILAGMGQADTLSEGHRKVSGVVEEVRGHFVKVRTATGILDLNQNSATQHGHAEYQVGDEVTIIMDENNSILEAHLKGTEGHHHFYTGKIIYLWKMEKKIKLETIDGEKIFPLPRLEIKTKPIKEGEVITVEVNESGTVIDLHRGNHGEVTHSR